MVIDFNNKVAVVTGGAGGIGLACVKNLLLSNAQVAVLDVSVPALDEAKDALKTFEHVRFYQVDICDVDSIGRTISKVREDMGEIEVLVQTAGLLRQKDGLELTVSDWDMMMNINARGMFFVMQQVVEQSMQKTGGAIVNFASMAGIRGMKKEMAAAHYSASKGAVVAMTMQAATEWAPYGIRCNAVAPGGVMTKAMAAMSFPEDFLDPVPLRRLSLPEDVADSVVFLASEQARMITGQTLVIDGGSSIVGY